MEYMHNFDCLQKTDRAASILQVSWINAVIDKTVVMGLNIKSTAFTLLSTQTLAYRGGEGSQPDQERFQVRG